jgi:hypothetical protein
VRVSHAKSGLLRCARAEFEALTRQSPGKVRMSPASFRVGCVGRSVVRVQGGGKATGKTTAKGGSSPWPSSGKSGGKSAESKGKRPHELTAEQAEAKRAKCVLLCCSHPWRTMSFFCVRAGLQISSAGNAASWVTMLTSAPLDYLRQVLRVRAVCM